MPVRPTTEELVAFLRTFHNIQQVDVDQFWRSTAPEILQVVARPIDIKETFTRNVTLTVVTGVVLSATTGFTVSRPDRIFVVRSLSVEQIAGAPDSVTIGMGSAVGTLERDYHATTTPDAAFPVGAPDQFTNNINAWLPQVLYNDQFLNVLVAIGIAASMDFTVRAEGEEFDIPLRNVAT